MQYILYSLLFLSSIILVLGIILFACLVGFSIGLYTKRHTKDYPTLGNLLTSAKDISHTPDIRIISPSKVKETSFADFKE